MPDRPTAGLDVFGSATREWFERSFAAPTPVQDAAWQAIARGEDALVIAPTGSGKTLAAFLSAIDDLVEHGAGQGTQVLYISPLKALGVDVQRNLRSPLAGLQQMPRAGDDPPIPAITVGIRSGDTDPATRRALVSRPPDILITTPESLFLMLTSQARTALGTVRTVIIDEIHAIAGTKRGVHLALSLQRLEQLAARRPQRIGLSATVRPPSAVAEFLSGEHPCTIVETPIDKQLQVSVDVPVPDLADLAAAAGPDSEDTPSIWPHIERRLVDLIDEHRSTLVFANSRRSAERLTARLNEEWGRRAEQPVELLDEVAADLAGGAGQSGGAPADLARAHHGSVSKEQRVEIEDLLKTGGIRAVVATSSLELGIDMGAVDLVAQVEAPPSVAAGLQRIGRAGHQVGAVSRGVVMPKHRGDLLASAVIADQMQQRRIEDIAVPRNPLDVLAQHIVAMASMDEWSVPDLFALVRSCQPYRSLPEDAFRAVLDMLAGRYPADEFATLRPRINWDRATDVISGRPGAQRLAVTSGGTIPDRGLFGVYLAGADARGGKRVGELDEEMVYESRVGDVFALGASSWRIEDIGADRVVVSPAPGRPGKLPFWHGDSIGRPYALGRELGGFTRKLAGGQITREALAADGLNDWAIENLQRYVGDQQQACGRVPDDRTIVVERFRDEIGDWRVVWHSPFGARVHAPWALLIGAAAEAEFGLDAQVVATDDGIIARLPDTGDEDFFRELSAAAFPDPDGIQDAVATQVAGSALFAARFRECASRALLLPRRDPGRRTPLWQQRQRSAQLLSVAAQYPTFPITLETMRECLQDVYDLPSLYEVMTEVAQGRIRVVEVETPQPSPFAQSLLFSYIASYMYEGDSPLAERKAQALALDPQLLASLLGDAQLRELLDPEAIAEVEASLQMRTPQTAVRSIDGAADAYRILGPMDAEQAQLRGITEEMRTELIGSRRLFATRLAGRDVLAATEDAARLRDAVGAPIPIGLPQALLEPVARPVRDLVARYARTHGPFPIEQAAAELGLGSAVVTDALQDLAASHRVVTGGFRPGHTGEEWCDAEVLRRLRRLSAARLQEQTEPVDQVALGRFLPQWSDVAANGSRPGLRGPDGVFAAIERLAGLPLPLSAWEQWILPARVDDYQPHWLDELMASGDVAWWGTAALPGRDGWIAMAPTDLVADLRPAIGLPEAPDDALTARVLSLLDAGGGWLFPQLLTTLAKDEPALTAGSLLDCLWNLVWAGRVGNDAFLAARAQLGRGGAGRTGAGRAGAGRTGTRRRRPGAASTPGTGVGRWSILPVAEDETRAATTQIERAIARHGLVVRGSLAAEPLPGGFSAAYKVLSSMAERGRLTRLYLVDGLGGAQFAAAGVVDRVRDTRQSQTEPTVHVLAATDPANPYGAALAWPAATETGHRPGRKAGAVVVLVEGAMAAYLERGARSLLTFEPDLLAAGLPALAEQMRRTGGRGAIQRVNGQAAASLHPGDPVRAALTDAGFVLTPSGLRPGSR